MTLLEKQNRLESILSEMGNVLVAFSGGVDSTLLLAYAQKVLGDHAMGVTAQSASVPGRELKAAKDLAQSLGAKHIIIATQEMQSENYRANPSNRCYYCKSELYSRLKEVARKESFSWIANGTNKDDLGDHRPGLESAKEAGVRSPLVEADLSKEEIRELSKQIGLPTWNKPAMPCLSSRIPYGQEVTDDKLKMIERAEDILISLGYTDLRVRHLGNSARVELPKTQIAQFIANGHWESVQEKLQALGFDNVLIDEEGFRSGKLNDVLQQS